jgi:hypothetical protein
MHVALLVIWTVVVPTGVTVLLGLHNPPPSWTGIVGSSYLTSLEPIVWIPCCAIGRSGGLSLSFKTVPKSKVRVCIYTIAFELSYLSLG